MRATDPCQLPKACKNEAELEGTRRAHVRDGAALSRFLAWFAREAPSGRLTEIDAVEKLEVFRRATGALKDVSFEFDLGRRPERRDRPLPRDEEDQPARSRPANCS